MGEEAEVMSQTRGEEDGGKVGAGGCEGVVGDFDVISFC